MDRAAIEADVRARLAAGDGPGAVEVVVKGYGPEVLTYLAGMLRTSDDELGEVFSRFCEDVCRGLARFRFDSTVRTWAYVVARRAALQHLRGERRRARRFDGAAELETIAIDVKSTTLQHLRTTNHDRLVAVRDQLDPEERAILILRVDRQLAWREIAQVMADGELDPEALRRREQALRKKFDTIKRHLREQLAGA